MTLTEIKEAFEGCASAEAAVNRNIRELSDIVKGIDRIRFECGYRKNGWFLWAMISTDPDYKDVVRQLTRLKWLKKSWQGEVGEVMDVEKARAVPITELIECKRKGGRWWAPCFLHIDKTASLMVNKDGRTAHCFSCSWHGDGIALVMKRDGLTFLDAIKYLNER